MVKNETQNIHTSQLTPSQLMTYNTHNETTSKDNKSKNNIIYNIINLSHHLNLLLDAS